MSLVECHRIGLNNYGWVYLKSELQLVMKRNRATGEMEPKPLWPHTTRHTFATETLKEDTNQLPTVRSHLKKTEVVF